MALTNKNTLWPLRNSAAMVSRSYHSPRTPFPGNPKHQFPSSCYSPLVSSAAVRGLCCPGVLSVRSRIPSIRAVDAAQSYDYEARLSDRLDQTTKLKIAIVGFGNFGQFLARAFVRQGHTVLAHSRSDYSATAASIGASFFSDPHDLCEEHPDVVLLCTSILSTKAVINAFPFHRLRRNTLLVDVLSVKEFPRNLMMQRLPPDFDILCTHPMFGPESGKDGWTGLPFVFDKVRVGKSEARQKRCERFLEIFEKEGCKMVEMSCAEHDMYAASSQFVTHAVGRVLAKLELKPTPISTKGYVVLLQLVENTIKDSFDLFYGLFMYNKNSTELIEKLEEAFDAVKKELFSQLHDIVRKQLFENGPPDKAS